MNEAVGRWNKTATHAVLLTLGLAAVSVWIVKIFGPRAINPDYFCNCSVAEGLTATLAWPVFAIACRVVALRLRKEKGWPRAVGVMAGIASLLFPALALLAVRFLTFPTIEELHGYTLGRL